MSKRIQTTAILATDNANWRVDFDKNLVPLADSASRIGESGEKSIVSAARAIAESEQGPGRNVVIFSTAIWSDLIRLPQSSLYGLETPELVTALRFEIETLAGIDAEDSAISAVDMTPVAGNRVFWINAISESEWTTIVELLSGRGVRSITLLHPAAATGSRKRNEENTWRIEYWQGAASLYSQSGELIAARQTPLDQANLLALLHGIDPEASLAQCHVVVDPDHTVDELVDSEFHEMDSLASPEKLFAWFQDATTSVIGQGPQSFPGLIHRYSSGSGLRQWLAASIVIAVLAGLCYWHYQWMNGLQSAMDIELSAIEEPAILKQKYDTLVESVLKDRSDKALLAAQSKVDVRKVQFLFTQQTDRLEKLLSMLANLRTSELVVKNITPEEKGVVVSGVSINGDSAPLMANRLRDLAAPMGWRIHPAGQTGELKMTSGGPWQFRILLEDVGPPELVTIHPGQSASRPASESRPVPSANLPYPVSRGFR